MINAEITRNPGENGLSVIRRFSRKVIGSGIIPRMRSLRFNTRVQSKFKIKQKALKSISHKTELAKLIKLGKVQVKPVRNH